MDGILTGNLRASARRFAKTALAAALYRTGANAVLGSFLGRSPLVVAYHRVVERFDREVQYAMPGMLVSRTMLERHLDAIGRRHRFVSLDELGAALERGERFRHPVAAVTFDDGYRDVYENAFPLLIRKGIPAAVFVVSDLIGTRHLQTHDKLYLMLTKALSNCSLMAAVIAHRLTVAAVPIQQRERITRAATDATALTRAILPGLTQAHVRQLMLELEAEIEVGALHEDGLLPMTWDMLAEMQSKGMTIGSHSCSHALLANEPAHVVARETTESRHRLARHLGTPAAHFAYPNGSFNAVTVKAVAESGYRFAYAACSHRSREYPLLTIPRVLLWERSSVDAFGEFAPTILACQTRGFLTGPSGCRRRSHR